MQHLLSIWTGLDMRRKVIAVLATIAIVTAFASLARMASRPGMALLYSGLESGAAGEVVRALEQRGASFQVRGGAIYVESAQRDELRMTLASEGLPANTTQGYELLDSLSGFGTTSQMFDAAYWRAKEGELARTILVSPQISAARVHIANAGSNPFQRQLKPTASVTITTTTAGLSPGQAQALKFLVASAVAGLSADDVAVIDGASGLIGAKSENAPQSLDGRTELLRQSEQRLLEARVGPGNAVVELSVDTVMETESVRERIVDPASRVAISTDTEEKSNSSRNGASGQVTVASNIPGGDAAQGQDSSNTNSESRERVNYEVSETQREILREPGAIRRLTVAVLINGTPVTSADGSASMEPRSDEELASLRELVASAVGFDSGRGDVITLKSMLFQPVEVLGTDAQSSYFAEVELDAMTLAQMAILGLVAIALGVFVVRPLITRAPTDTLPDTAIKLPGNGELDPGNNALTGLIDDTVPPGIIDSSDGPNMLPTPAGQTQGEAVERLRALISDRQEETVEILRSWLDDKEERV